jgi:hypothetical protein
MKKLILLAATLVFASAAFAEDFEYNTGGTIDMTPTTAGSAAGWGEWFLATVENDTGHDLILMEFGFPCCGPPTGTYGWVVWTDMGGLNPPAGEADTAEYYGAFTPADAGHTSPPVVYSYIDVSASSVIIPAGNYFCWGYDNTDLGGQIAYNGVETWGWYNGMWESDEPYGRTGLLQVKADYYTALDQTTWGSIKSVF